MLLGHQGEVCLRVSLLLVQRVALWPRLLAEVPAGHKYHVTGALPLGHDVCHVANVDPTAQPAKPCLSKSQPATSVVD